jgi:hypothetical protein
MKIYLCISLLVVLLMSSMSFASDTMKSRFGDVTVKKIVDSTDPENVLAEKKYIVKLGDKIIYETEPAMMSTVNLNELFKIKNSDVLLINYDLGGNIGVSEYTFITISKNGFKLSKSFTGFSVYSLMKVKQKGTKIEVTYEYIKDKDMTRPPVIYEKGEIKVKKGK